MESTTDGARRARWAQWAGGVIVAAVAAGSLAGCTSSGSEPGATDDRSSSTAAERLYVLDAASGTSAADGDGVEVSLALDDERVTWFQDRPSRGHGEVSAPDLAGDWRRLGFAEDPPNVVIAPDGRSPVAIEAARARFDASTGTLRLWGSAADERGAALPKEFDGASVLIDGVSGDAPGGDASGASASREFAQRAGSVSIEPTEGGRFTLSMIDASPRTTWVTDRPHRSAGTIDDQAFVDRWAVEGFATDPPNAELVIGSGKDAQRIAVELANPSYDADAGALSYAAQVLPEPGASPFTATEVPSVDDPDQPSTLFIDGASTVETQFGQQCGQREEWKPAHQVGGSYIIEAWGADGGRGGNSGGPGGSGGYTISRIDATEIEMVAAGLPIMVTVGCAGEPGGTVARTENDTFDRGAGGGGGGSTAVRVWDTDHTTQPGCVPARVWIVNASTNCNVFAVAGGGGGGGGGTQGFPTSAGGAGGYRGNVGSGGGDISGFNLLPASGGGGGGSNTAPTGGRCGSWEGGGNEGSCKGTTTQGFDFNAIGVDGSSGAGGAGGAAAYPGSDEPSSAGGGDGGIAQQIVDHDGTGGAGPDGNSYAADAEQRKSGSGPGGGGGGWGGGGGGTVSFMVSPSSLPGSASGGGGGGSFSYSEGTGWSAGTASPGGTNGWVRISWDPGGVLPIVVTADGTVNANVQSGWINGGATTSNGMRWVGRGKVGASGVLGAAASNGAVVAIARDGDALRAHSSSDGGATWKEAGTLPSGITWAAMDATDDMVVVASPDGKVAYSSDAGATWTTADTGLSKLTAIDRIPGVAGGFAAVGGSKVALGSASSGSLSWQVDTADSPGKDLVAVAGVGPAVVVVDQATGTASTKSATLGGSWSTTSAPLPQHGTFAGAAGTDTATAVPGIDPTGIVGSVVVIDSTSPTVDVNPGVKADDAGTWPTKNIGELHEEGSSSTNRPQIIQQCRGIFYVANAASSTQQAQVWTSGDVASAPETGMGWLTGMEGTVPADVVAIVC